MKYMYQSIFAYAFLTISMSVVGYNYTFYNLTGVDVIVQYQDHLIWPTFKKFSLAPWENKTISISKSCMRSIKIEAPGKYKEIADLVTLPRCYDKKWNIVVEDKKLDLRDH